MTAATKKLSRAKKEKEVVREAIVNNEPKLLSDAWGVGESSWQGDLCIVRIASLPKSAKPRKNRQLADGNTQGSRHVMERGDVYDADAKEIAALIKAANKCVVETQYIGPVFVSPEKPTARDLNHPEHGPQGFPAGSVCAVVFQRSLDAEERAQRVVD